LELGEKTTQGKRTVQAVNYEINADDPKSSMTGTVWIDLRTHLPQKRTVTLKGFSAEENYTNWKLDTPIEEATFSLTDKN
jgi:outer membrane lipoprotein-sorting protein